MSWSIEHVDDVAVVTMTTEAAEKKEWTFFHQVTDVCDRLEDEFPDSALVLIGEGHTFAGGLDTEAILSLFARNDAEEIRGWFARFSAILLRLFTLPRPTVAALNGDAVGSDLLTACACDFRIAVDHSARIGLDEVHHGIPLPSVFLEMLRYAVGSRATSAAALSGQLYDPDAALALGLVHQLTPGPDLLETAIRAARRLAMNPRRAYATTKHLLQADTLERMDRLSTRLDTSLAAALFSDANLAARSGVWEGSSRSRCA